MNAAGPPPSAEELLAHAGFVRAVARALLGDPHRAEDAVQETWLAALRRPPGDRARLRGWLGGVVRRISIGMRRREGRRVARERRAARPVAGSGADETVAGLEMQRIVVEALHALEEPYRSTLFQRFYHDRGPGEIARLERIPVRTVESRLRRGLTRLRAEMDRRARGGRASWCAGLAALLDLGPRAATRTSSWSAGAVALALAGTLLGVAALFSGLSGPAPERRAPGGAEHAADAATDGPLAARSGVPLPPAPEAASDKTWRRILAAADAADLQRAEVHALIERVRDFLAEQPRYRTAVLPEILLRDSAERWSGAAVLAAAACCVPDERLALELAEALPRIRERALRNHLTSALGANRHGLQPLRPGYGEGCLLTHLGTPILEPEVRRILLEQARAAAAARDDSRLLALQRVLQFSQDRDRAIAAFLDARADRAEAHELGNALWPLRVSRRREVIERFRRLAEQPEEASPAISAVAFALLRTGEPRDTLALFDLFASGELSVESEFALLQQLIPLQTRDPLLLDRWVDLLLDVATDRGRARLQHVALGAVPLLLMQGHRVEEVIAAVKDVAADPGSSLAARTQAVTSLGKTRRAEMESWLWRIVASQTEHARVRAAAFREWVRYATPRSRPAMLRSLEGLRSGVISGGELESAFEDALARLGR